MKNHFYMEQLTHLALTQFHRWYQVYEFPFNEARIANQKDLLDDQVIISSQNGSTRGKDGLEERLMVFKGWKNAHHVQHTEITMLNNGLLSLEADILYQNIRPDLSRHCYTLHYSTQLRTRAHNLPLFTKVNLQPTGMVDNFIFEETYSKNRVISFIHYWFYLIACADIPPLEELLNNDFSLILSKGEEIRDLASLEIWLGKTQSTIYCSTHSYNDLQIHQQREDMFEVRFNVQCRAIKRDHQEIFAEARLHCLLTNNPDERFLRMKSMEVQLLVPWQPVVNF